MSWRKLIALWLDVPLGLVTDFGDRADQWALRLYVWADRHAKAC
jgi:hypothetical protein